jgi:hypothetical protein
MLIDRLQPGTEEGGWSVGGRVVGTRPLPDYSGPAFPGKIAKILTCALGARVAYLCEGANSGSNFGAKRDIVFV